MKNYKEKTKKNYQKKRKRKKKDVENDFKSVKYKVYFKSI